MDFIAEWKIHWVLAAGVRPIWEISFSCVPQGRKTLGRGPVYWDSGGLTQGDPPREFHINKIIGCHAFPQAGGPHSLEEESYDFFPTAAVHSV